jgi:hypothetical protein
MKESVAEREKDSRVINDSFYAPVSVTSIFLIDAGDYRGFSGSFTLDDPSSHLKDRELGMIFDKSLNKREKNFLTGIAILYYLTMTLRQREAK